MDSHNLVRLSRMYAERRGRKISTVSRDMGGSGDTLTRLERGHDITTRRAARFVQWLSNHWPADLAWPSDIPRPPPRSAGAPGQAA